MTFDRFLIKEFFKYLFLAVACVVTIYLLIDLFEQLDYFASRHATIITVLAYYLYNLPFAVSLLFPVGVILSCFFVYGTLIRERSLHVFQIAGVNIYRLFVPIIGIGIALIFVQFFSMELITIPANRKLEIFKRDNIEKRQSKMPNKKNNLFVRGRENVVFFIREYEAELHRSQSDKGIMRDFIIAYYDRDGRIEKRIDGLKADFLDNQWQAQKATVRIFSMDSIESYLQYDSLILPITERPDYFTQDSRIIEELNIWELRRYIQQLKIAGVRTAKAEVEYHYRFANAFILLIMILLSLSLIVRIKQGGVMFGLGLGLLFSFLYWGLVQVFKAYGQALIIKPFLAAWLANFIFLAVDLFLLYQVRKYA